jgi:hypothetical protein
MPKNKKKAMPKPSQIAEEDEQIILSSEMQIANESKKVQRGSQQMWKFKDAVVLGKHA